MRAHGSEVGCWSIAARAFIIHVNCVAPTHGRVLYPDGVLSVKDTLSRLCVSGVAHKDHVAGSQTRKSAVNVVQSSQAKDAYLCRVPHKPLYNQVTTVRVVI